MEQNHNGKVAIVTGGNAGIGRWTCLSLAKAGFIVIMCTRSIDKGNKSVEEIKEIVKKRDPSFNGKLDIRVAKLDLCDLKSIKMFVEWFDDLKLPNLDLLVNNGGVMDIPLSPDNKVYIFFYFFIILIFYHIGNRETVFYKSSWPFLSHSIVKDEVD